MLRCNEISLVLYLDLEMANFLQSLSLRLNGSGSDDGGDESADDACNDRGRQQQEIDPCKRLRNLFSGGLVKSKTRSDRFQRPRTFPRPLTRALFDA